ncbi:MAG: hypothetical protein Q7R66_00295 [Undibacterium sp.]|nr:hypothetical protein [Undibacterium sp.]
MEAAQCVLDIQLRYAQVGSSLALAAMAGARRREELIHYPARDVFDPKNGTSFFYHAHRSKKFPINEHGHFHLFFYEKKLNDIVSQSDDFSHFIGLSLDDKGLPLRWFTTNRWVSGEQWRPAGELVQLLPTFLVQTNGRLAPVANWINAMVRLFQPQIAQLLYRRDKLMARHIASSGREFSFENRKLDVITECSASLPAKIKQLGF